MRSPRIPADRSSVFWCEKLEKDLPAAACLRRQAERAKVKHPKTGELVDSPAPLHGYCATACEQGREIRSALAEAPAAAAPAERPEPKLNSDRIWTDEVPDPPIAAPRARSAGLGPEVEAAVAGRVAAVMAAVPRRRPQARPPWMPPPTPFHEPGTTELEELQEESMPAEKKLCENCLEKPLRSDNKSGWCVRCTAAPLKHRAPSVAARLAKEAQAKVDEKAPKEKSVETCRPVFDNAPVSGSAFESWTKEPGHELGAPPPPRLALSVVPSKPGAPFLGADGKVRAEQLPDLTRYSDELFLELGEAWQAERSRRVGQRRESLQRLERAGGAAA